MSSAILQNIYSFLEVLHTAGTEAVGEWDTEALEHALKWAEYCEKIYQQSQGKPYQNDLDAAIKKFEKLPITITLETVDLELLKNSKQLIRKTLLQNCHVPSAVYKSLLHSYGDLIQHPDLFIQDCVPLVQAKARSQMSSLLLASTDQSTDQSTDHPTDNRTGNPTDNRTDNRTGNPTGNRTDNRTGNRTDNRTGNPTDNRTGNPTGNPTENPTDHVSLVAQGQLLLDSVRNILQMQTQHRSRYLEQHLQTIAKKHKGLEVTVTALTCIDGKAQNQEEAKERVLDWILHKYPKKQNVWNLPPSLLARASHFHPSLCQSYLCHLQQQLLWLIENDIPTDISKTVLDSEKYRKIVERFKHLLQEDGKAREATLQFLETVKDEGQSFVWGELMKEVES